jgi:hypothetical protein
MDKITSPLDDRFLAYGYQSIGLSYPQPGAADHIAYIKDLKNQVQSLQEEVSRLRAENSSLHLSLKSLEDEKSMK